MYVHTEYIYLDAIVLLCSDSSFLIVTAPVVTMWSRQMLQRSSERDDQYGVPSLEMEMDGDVI